MKLLPRRLLVLAGCLLLPAGAAWAQDENVLVVDPSAPTHPFTHFWETAFGSGRASLSLRESYRNDLREVKRITDLKYVRFHGIFLDEAGIYDEDARGNAVYNFSYIDQIYDGLLNNGVRPIVELSFMPKKLAARDMPHPFWYKPNVSPPKDWQKWDGLITEFLKHLIARYGEDEISHWYFEVWNEPNLDFWGGKPKQASYWKLYDHTAQAIKAVSSRAQVGGPATAQAAWVDSFIRHCVEDPVPVDFVSTHVYGNDSAQDVFGVKETIPRDQMVGRAVKKVHEQIKASSRPELPLIWTEYNASYMYEPAVTDSIYMGPWLADTVRQCDGFVDVLAYWTFSDVFEEDGVVKTPFYGGFGLLAAGGIPKPAFNAFKLLHQLGTERIALDSNWALLTRCPDGSLVLAVWNYVAPAHTAAPKTVLLRFKGLESKRALIFRLDAGHGDVHPAYKQMGSPRYPTGSQIQQLKAAAEIGAPEVRDLNNNELTLSLPAYGLAVIELK